MAGWQCEPRIFADERGSAYIRVHLRSSAASLDAFYVVGLDEQILREPLVILHRLVINPRRLLPVDEMIDHPRRRHAVDRDELV